MWISRSFLPISARTQAKIKKFQQLTDRFRGGLIKAQAYYAGVEELFGEENVEVRYSFDSSCERTSDKQPL